MNFEKPSQEEIGQEPKRVESQTPKFSEGYRKTTDVEYLHSLSAFRRDHNWNEGIGGDEDFDATRREYGKILEKISDTKTLERLQPAEAAGALAQLAFETQLMNPIQEENAKKGTEKKYAEARGLFMDSCHKLYPNVKISPDNLAAEISQACEGLVKAGFAVSDHKEDLERLQVDPAEVLYNLEAAISFLPGNLAERGQETFWGGASNPEASKLAMAVESYYKLELLKDAVKAKIGDKGDTSKSDKSKEAEPELSAQERKIIDLSARLVGTEKVKSEIVDMGDSVMTKSFSPAIEAFRRLYKTDEVFSARLLALAETVSQISQGKLKDKIESDPQLSLLHAIQEVYNQLPTNERASLDTASKTEGERVFRLLKQKGGLTTNFSAPPLTLFRGLIEKVIENK
jgi:hypothetical protein